MFACLLLVNYDGLALSTYYRHVTIPRDLVGDLPKGRIMKEIEWRKLGIIQSCGWDHYSIHK